MKFIHNYNEFINENLNNNFKKWFGKSKMVDSNGNPIVCYHGTNREFNEFKYLGHVHDTGFYGEGFYFTFGHNASKGEAAYYGRNIMGCVNIELW